jgi:hypothetical protein
MLLSPLALGAKHAQIASEPVLNIHAPIAPDVRCKSICLRGLLTYNRY